MCSKSGMCSKRKKTRAATPPVNTGAVRSERLPHAGPSPYNTPSPRCLVALNTKYLHTSQNGYIIALLETAGGISALYQNERKA